MFHFHKWSKWESYVEQDVISGLTGGVIGYSFIQKRVCEKCGFVQYNQQQTKAEG